MSQRARQAVEEELELEGIRAEEAELHELNVRRRQGRCTCDLLEPYGHVTCPACNETLG
jgi:hypothetical protein